jgi:hypothetical protein
MMWRKLRTRMAACLFIKHLPLMPRATLSGCGERGVLCLLGLLCMAFVPMFQAPV